MRRLIPVTVLFAIFLLPVTAFAQMTLISQSRSIDVSAEIFDENSGESWGWSEDLQAIDFASFEEMLFADASDFFGYCDAEASQESTLGPGMFVMSGIAYTDAELFEPEYSAYAYAGSYFEAEFSIAVTADWSLNGTVEAQAAAIVEVLLVDDFGTTIFSQSWSNASLPFLVVEGGTLGAGTYTLIVNGFSSEDLFEPGFYLASQAVFDLQFDVSGGASPVGDELARGRYLSAGPNPMQNKTMIAFAGVPGHSVELDVYDVRGRLVRRLLDAGGSSGQVAWDGRNSAGQLVPQGVYFVRMRDGQALLQRKVTVIR